MVSGRSTASVSNASPTRISTRSSRPASRRWPAARRAFSGSNSVVIRRPPPLSRNAAARWMLEMPNEVPNSTMVRAPLLRASRYSRRPVSGDTGSHRSFSSSPYRRRYSVRLPSSRCRSSAETAVKAGLSALSASVNRRASRGATGAEISVDMDGCSFRWRG
ncbi:hypothetical protein D3C78_1453990 [compost metagenome]